MKERNRLNFFDWLMGTAIVSLPTAILMGFCLPADVENIPIDIGIFVIVMGLVTVAGRGLATGEMWVRGGSIFRADDPTAFWGLFLFYLSAASLFGFATLFGLFRF